MKNVVPAKRAFLDLLFIKVQVNKLLGRKEKYKDLIAYMMSEDFLESEDPLPSLKSMENTLNLKTHALRKLITDLYNELFGNELEYGLEFSIMEVYFDLRYFEGHLGFFKCDKLAFMPRVGENITIPFLKAKVGTDWFYVDRIRHTLEERTQRIDISLRAGTFSPYLHYEKYKAYEEGSISLANLFNMHDLELKRKMGLR